MIYQVREAKIHIVTRVKRGRAKAKVHVKDETLGEAIMSDQPLSTVSYAASFTKGLPSYSSVKCDVHVSIPCENSHEARAKTFLRARKFVMVRLKKEMTTTMQELEDGIL